MTSFKDDIKNILLRDNLISEADLQKALDEQKVSGGELSKILVRLNIISEDTLTQILIEGLGLPPINIARLKVDPAVVKLIPKDMAQKYRIMPISLIGDNLALAMADPLNIFVMDNIQALTGLKINPIIGRAKDIEDTIAKYYFEVEGQKASQAIDEIMKDLKDPGDLELVKDVHSENRASVEQLTDDAPIIKLTDTIIQQAVIAKASDVFIEPMENCVRIRYRIDGVIREIDRLAKVLHFPIISRIKVISNLDISEHRLPQDGRFKTILSSSREVDFRVNVLPTAIGEKIVLRVLDKGGSVLDVDRLGFEPDQLAQLKDIAAKPHGLILACGPTGSGKTTTLYSILKYVDSPGKNIVTVEDPVEYQMKGLNQVNIKPAMGLTFPICLRSILRQDPDIIMIGEVRDSETLDIAIKAALTGHLVLTSLHTTTAAGSIVRMMNMGIEPFLICSSTLAIVAQRLLRRVCLKCREKYVVPKAMAQQVGLAKLVKTDLDKIELYRPKGCEDCYKTGYKGRVGINEILFFSLKIKETVLSRAGEMKIKEVARHEGMVTMREDGLIKALAGHTTLEEVLRITAQDEEIKHTK